MKYLIIVSILLSGCAEKDREANGLIKFHDKENGVICYQRYDGSPLSCVVIK